MLLCGPETGHSDIFVKKVASFCPCPKSLSNAKLKSFVLILLAEEISKLSSIDSVVMLPEVTLIKIYN